MAKRKVSMNKLREILRLKEICALSERKVSKAINLSRPVVNEYLKRCAALGLNYPAARDMPDDVLEALLKQKEEPTTEDTRYNALAELFEHIAKELKRVGVTRKILWEEYRRDNPDGYGYSQFCYHYQKWANLQELSMHIEHKAGENMFVDFTGKKLAIVDRESGKPTPVETYVGILGASKLIYVEVVKSQKKHDFISATDNAIRYTGGVVEAIVPDNLKSAVTKAHRYEPDLNLDFVNFARHYDLAILPARPNKPRDKALVEGAVKIVYQQIYAPLRDRVFHSLDDLNAAIRVELERLNSMPMKGYGKSRWELFNEVEKDALRPLPAERYCIQEHCRMKVAFNYHVYLKADSHYYSVPYQYRGLYVDLFYSEKTVEIYHKNERIALHARARLKYKYTTVLKHMPPEHRYKEDWCAERFLSWAESIDNDVKTFIDRVLSSRRHPEQAYKSCLGILNLARAFGKERLADACRIALKYETYTYKMIDNILKHRLERALFQEGLFDAPLPEHENIRGRDYYTREVAQ